VKKGKRVKGKKQPSFLEANFFTFSLFHFFTKIKNAFRFCDKRKALNKIILSEAKSIIIVVESNRVHKNF